MGFLSSLVGGGLGVIGNILGGDKQEDVAKDFAKKGIQWRVKDAEKAGVHPLYALGANVAQAPSISVGDYGLGEMGQGLGRAIESGFTHEGKAAAAMTKLSLENAGLQNEKLRTEIALARQAGQPPARPGGSVLPVIEGQNDGVKIVPPQRTSHLKVGGVPWKTHPGTVDAQTIEDRLGDSELVSLGTAALIGGADTWYNLSPYVKRAYQALIRAVTETSDIRSQFPGGR